MGLRDDGPSMEMTKFEAAQILKRLVEFTGNRVARGNGFGMTTLKTIFALNMAIDLLEKTPDEGVDTK